MQNFEFNHNNEFANLSMGCQHTFAHACSELIFNTIEIYLSLTGSFKVLIKMSKIMLKVYYNI